MKESISLHLALTQIVLDIGIQNKYVKKKFASFRDFNFMMEGQALGTPTSRQESWVLLTAHNTQSVSEITIVICFVCFKTGVKNG